MKTPEELATERTVARVGRQPSEPGAIAIVAGGAAYLVLLTYKFFTNIEASAPGVFATVGVAFAAGFLITYFRRRKYRETWNEEFSRIRPGEMEG